ncbi:MAG: protein kinase [Planctomycetales bacterium]|nr:protein kinase [Planctomycetales bacterium]
MKPGGEAAPKVELPPNLLHRSDKPDSIGRLSKYEVEKVIGHGGFGIVLKAFDPSAQRVVAIKVLSPSLATDAMARLRFMREAQAAAAVDHTHIVKIHAVEDQHEPLYLVMEYVDGKTLQERLDQHKRFELCEILRIAMQTAAGLAAAHAQGVVHRDIKPGNILLKNHIEQVKVTDFGLAQVVGAARITQIGSLSGTPEFMSPEQARGEKGDHRSDLFSLGSVMYAMCSGHSPFQANNKVEVVISKVCDDSPRSIHKVNPEIPKWLAKIIHKLLAKRPDDRYQSAKVVAELLERHLKQLQQPSSIRPPHDLGRLVRKLAVIFVVTLALSLIVWSGVHFLRSTTITKTAPQETTNGRTSGHLNSTEREIAKWVLNQGGKVWVHAVVPKEEWFTGLEQLPAKDFEIKGIDLAGIKGVGDADLKEIAKVSRLQDLRLSNTQISDAGLRDLRRHSELHWLYIDHIQLTDSGLETLAELKELESLHLAANTRITDAGLKHLARLQKLSWLDISDTEVSGAGLEHLEALTELRALFLRGSKVTDSEKQRWQNILAERKSKDKDKSSPK